MLWTRRASTDCAARRSPHRITLTVHTFSPAAGSPATSPPTRAPFRAARRRSSATSSLSGSSACPRADSLGWERHRNRFGFRVAVDALAAEFTSVAAALHAAERREGIHRVALVDAERAGADAGGD